jgi:sortase B
VLSSVLLLSISGFLLRLLEYRSAAVEYAEIAQQMENLDRQTATPVFTPEKADVQIPTALPLSPTTIPLASYNEDIGSLKAKNKDTVGYIEIKGTAIKYPVVQGKDNNYYENHTFSKKKNASGAIFMDSTNAADLSDFNLILYGHNMKDGSMFHELLQYRKTAFTREHRNIVLAGLYENKTYYVFSAYTCSQDTDVRGFQYNTADERQVFLNVIMKRSVISAGSANPTADDQIITLVTCRENSSKDYFVVHGIFMK